MVKLIVAKAENNVIGKDNDLVWHLPDDMKFFTQMTTGNIVIMGRRNWESIPDKYRPLPNRTNVVVTRNEIFSADGCTVFSSVEKAIEHYRNETNKTIYIIGGGQVYKYSIEHELIDEMLITEVHGKFDGDTFFPEFDPNNWKREKLSEHAADKRHDCAFTIYRYTKQN